MLTSDHVFCCDLYTVLHLYSHYASVRHGLQHQSYLCKFVLDQSACAFCMLSSCHAASKTMNIHCYRIRPKACADFTSAASSLHSTCKRIHTPLTAVTSFGSCAEQPITNCTSCLQWCLGRRPARSTLAAIAVQHLWLTDDRMTLFRSAGKCI